MVGASRPLPRRRLSVLVDGEAKRRAAARAVGGGSLDDELVDIFLTFVGMRHREPQLVAVEAVFVVACDAKDVLSHCGCSTSGVVCKEHDGLGANWYL